MNTSDAIDSVTALLTAIALLVTVVFSIVTVVFNLKSLRAAKQDSVANTFITLNQRLQETLYGILEENREILKETDADGPRMKPFMFRFYRLLDIMADMWAMRGLMEEFDTRLWDRARNRIGQLLRKPAVRAAWSKQLSKNREIFDPGFIGFVEEESAKADAPRSA